MRGSVDITQLDYRLREVDRKARSGAYARKKEALVLELEAFLECIPGGGDVRSVDDKNLRRFLAHKDQKGKTQVHLSDCEHLA